MSGPLVRAIPRERPWTYDDAGAGDGFFHDDELDADTDWDGDENDSDSEAWS